MKRIALFLMLIVLISAAALSKDGNKAVNSNDAQSTHPGMMQGSQGSEADNGSCSPFSFGA